MPPPRLGGGPGGGHGPVTSPDRKVTAGIGLGGPVGEHELGTVPGAPERLGRLLRLARLLASVVPFAADQERSGGLDDLADDRVVRLVVGEDPVHRVVEGRP